MNEFQGKVAIVTGGTSGIGRAAAIAYAREGAKVVVAGRRTAEGEETVRLVQAQGGEALFVPTDVAQEAQVKNLIGRTLQQFGRLDFAFNNAGIEQTPTPLVEQTVETYDQVMNITVKGVWLSMKCEIPAMLKTGGGSIVNTSSGVGVIGLPGVEIYVASKHAVIGLTKSAALEFGKQGIRINAVLPAVIETDMFQRFAGEQPGIPRPDDGLAPHRTHWQSGINRRRGHLSFVHQVVVRNWSQSAGRWRLHRTMMR